MELNFSAFVDNLSYMVVGMACIFIVIGAIILAVALLDRITTALSSRNGEDTQSNRNG